MPWKLRFIDLFDHNGQCFCGLWFVNTTASISERRKLQSVNSGHLGDTSDFVIQWISANAWSLRFLASRLISTLATSHHVAQESVLFFGGAKQNAIVVETWFVAQSTLRGRWNRNFWKSFRVRSEKSFRHSLSVNENRALWVRTSHSLWQVCRTRHFWGTPGCTHNPRNAVDL